MQVRYTTGIDAYKTMTTEQLRETFLIDTLFQPGQVDTVYCEVERAIVGSVVPVSQKLTLKVDRKEMAADYFCQRREVGVLNIGGKGKITIDGGQFVMDNLDCLYIGKGSEDVVFASDDTKNPAKYYIVSYPAHKEYPTVQAKKADANALNLGSEDQCNKRTIYQYIHLDGIQSCQLVMGFTQLAPGSVWNTMPAHTHQRRTEVYMYFNIADDAVVFHLMGPVEQTRHLTMRNAQVALSPMWSIHSGVGTENYDFVWAMGGENQAFDDMDHCDITALK